MPLLKTSPRVQIEAPSAVFAGVPFCVGVVLHCREPVPIDRIELQLEGKARVLIPIGESPFTTVILGGQRVVLVREDVELAAQTHRFTGELWVPDDLPGSYRGPRLMIQWSLHARVSIPWWPDPTRTIGLWVHERPRHAAAPAPPTLYTSALRGPAGRRPYAEISLASTVAHPGGVLQGYLSLANTAYNRYRDVTLSLCQYVRVGHSFGNSGSASEVVSTIQVQPPTQDHQPIPFALRVPAPLIAAFAFRRELRLSWHLRCVIRVAGASDLTLHVDLAVVPSAEPAPPHHAPSLAVIGSERLLAVWSAAAQDTGFTYEAGALLRHLPRCTLAIGLEPRPRTGTRLVADARVPEIDIGLRVDEGRLRCRDPAHAERIAEATDPFTAKHRLESADDRHVRYSVDDGGTRREALVILARWFEALVTTLLDARERLPAPASVAHLEPAFERAASMLGGTLVPAGMDVWGQRGELPFSLESRWDGSDRYCSTTLTVGTSLPIDARYHGQAFPDGWPEVLPEGLDALLEGATGLVVSPYRIELHLPPLPADAASPEVIEPIEPIEPIVERLEALIAVGRRLSMLDGIYR